MTLVDFYFDYSCPWSYLAFVRLTETATRTGADIRWRPIVLNELLEQVSPGQPASRVPTDPRKLEYEAQDIDAWSDYVGVRISQPDDWPIDPRLAAAGGMIADQQGKTGAFSDAVFSAYFGLGKDIADVAVLAGLAEVAGLDRSAFECALTDTTHAQSVTENANTLLSRGGFGAPTMFVGKQMFFGSDRMPLVEFALGQSSGKSFILPGQHG